MIKTLPVVRVCYSVSYLCMKFLEEARDPEPEVQPPRFSHLFLWGEFALFA